MTDQFATVLPFPLTGVAGVGVTVGDARGPAFCGCGHAAAAHEHYRLGTDCGFCGARHCPSFRPVAQPAAGA